MRKRLSVIGLDPIALLLILFVASLFVPVALAEVVTFTVPPLSYQTYRVTVSSGDRVTGSVSVSGGSGNDVDFRIIDPSGNQIASYGRITYKTFEFTSSSGGTYQFVFDNSFSLISSKSVTFEYTVHKMGLVPSEWLGGSLAPIVAVAGVVILIAVGIGIISSLAARAQPRPEAQYSYPPPPAQQYNCPHCSRPLVFVSEYQRWFCPNCQRYV